MWVIFTTSLMSWFVIIERSYFLYFRYRINADHFLEQIVGYLEERKFSRAIEFANLAGGHPLALVLKAGLVKCNESEKDIQRSMEAASRRAAPAITKNIPYLAMLANVATLLGLLGTILGLVESFRGVSHANLAVRQEILSNGISVAMFTTAFGLMAAIPCIVAFTILQIRQNFLLSQIETKANDLFNYLSSRNRKLIQNPNSGHR